MAEDGPYQEPDILIPTISDELLQHIYSPEFNLEKALKTDEFYQLAWIGHHAVIDVLCKHVDEFLRFLCLPQEEIDPNVLIPLLRVFRKHKQIVDAVIDGNFLYPMSITVFARKKPESVLMLCHVTATTIARDRKKFTEHSGFVFQFIRYLEYSNVHSFFMGLVSKRADNESIHTWLIKGGFHILLADEIQHYDPEDNSMAASNRIFHTISILRHSLAAKILAQVFHDAEVAQSLMKGIGTWIPYIENERLLTLSALYCDSLKPTYQTLTNQLVEVIIKMQGPILMQHTATIDLLGLMLYNDEDVREQLMESGVHDHILDLAIKFPCHSNLHVCVVRYFYRVLNSPCISWPVGVPIMLKLLKHYQHNNVALINETCLAVFQSASEATKCDIVLKGELRKYQEIQAFFKRELAEREKRNHKDYGGSSPKPDKKRPPDDFRRQFGL